MKQALTFDDVQIVPAFSNVRHRENCTLTTSLSINKSLSIPLLSSPMDTVTEDNMAIAIGEMGGLGVVHRFCTIDQQVTMIKKVAESLNHHVIAAAIGVTKDYIERAQDLVSSGADVLVLDVAHGHHYLVKEALYNLKKTLDSSVNIIAGSIATKDAAIDLCEWGADALRVGIGNGCFTPNTMIKTKHGDRKITNVRMGDEVYTHTGELKTVTHTHEFSDKKEIVEINNTIECTPNHEFYVVHEKYADKVTDNNIHEYAEWIEAEKLSDDYYIIEYYPYLCELCNKKFKTAMGLSRQGNTIMGQFKLTKINSIKKKSYTGKVYDLTVEDNHSYIANNIVVHNSLCTTRIMTGVGIPQITALQETSKVADTYGIPVIADGGIRYPADIAKSIAAGADSVMIGSLFAGTKESPGTIIKDDRNWPNVVRAKKYRGSASRESKLDRNENTHVEGTSKIIPYKGKVYRIIDELLDGLRSAMSYVGSSDLQDFKSSVKLVQVTNAGILEAHPHLFFEK